MEFDSVTHSARAEGIFVRTAESHLGRWYIWGGDDPSGFDCSGLVIECLKSVGILETTTDLTADGLWQLFKPRVCSVPSRGCLVFYFTDERATHIGIAIDQWHYITADGGGSKCVNAAEAAKRNAFIKVRPINSRTRHRRYVRLF